MKEKKFSLGSLIEKLKSKSENKNKKEKEKEKEKEKKLLEEQI